MTKKPLSELRDELADDYQREPNLFCTHRLSFKAGWNAGISALLSSEEMANVRAALEFYGNEDGYHGKPIYPTNPKIGDGQHHPVRYLRAEVEMDEGEKARLVLKQLEKLGGVG